MDFNDGRVHGHNYLVSQKKEVEAKFTDAQISDIMEQLPPVYIKREDGYWETIYVYF